MTRETMKANAQANIDVQKRLAKEGKDFSATVIVESERIIEVADMPFTNEELDRLHAIYAHPVQEWNKAQDIKDKYGLSWNELKQVARLEKEVDNLTTIKAIRSYSKLTQAAFAEKYNIPKRSIENWEGGKTQAPEYLIQLLARVVKEDF